MVKIMMLPNFWQNFLQLLPLKVSEAKPYFGTFVLIEVEKSNGQKIEIRALMCDWRLQEKEKTLATSSIDMRDCTQHFHSLVGSNLTDIVKHEGECLELVFDTGKSFFLSANLEEYDKDDDIMMIYVCGQYGIRYTPNRGFEQELD